MDLPPCSHARPELALVDELAHTNAPGVEHRKRYEDIADLLAAGIDVYSTVNVQHLESLNDQVTELTGARVRETFPDSVLSDADEVVLVDLTPGALIERLRAGKVYPEARVPAALNGFFRVEHLEALREVALRQVAEDVEAKRLKPDVLPPRADRLMDSAAPQAVGERLLALVTPQPAVAADRATGLEIRAAPRGGARRADRPAARAVRCRARADRGVPPARVAARGERHRRGRRRRRRGRRADRARAALDIRAIGTPAPRSGLRRLADPLTERLLRALPGVDIRIVADRSKREWAKKR